MKDSKYNKFLHSSREHLFAHDCDGNIGKEGVPDNEWGKTW